MGKIKSGVRSPSAHRTKEQMLNHGRTYQATAEQRANRVKRGQARAALAKKGAVKKGDGKDVHHKQSLMKGGGNAGNNLKAVPRSQHRASHTKKGGRKT